MGEPKAWRQAAAEYSYSEAMGLALGLHASAPEALVAVRGGGATPSLRTSGIGPAPLAVREAAVRRVVLDPAPERSAAAAVAATARSPLALLPPLPSSDRSDLGAPYAPWPEADGDSPRPPPLPEELRYLRGSASGAGSRRPSALGAEAGLSRASSCPPPL